MPHSQQLNDLTASVSISAYLNRPFTWHAPVPWNVGGSENQKAEGKLAGLLQNRTSLIASQEFLAVFQTKRGETLTHQGKEYATTTHAPHWYRLMSVALWYATKFVHSTPLFDAIINWWREDQFIRDQYRVPFGPLTNQIIGWGARDGGMHGHDTSGLRDIVDALIMKRPLDSKQTHIVANATNNKDTFALRVISDIVREHDAFASIATNAIQPKIVFDLQVVKTETYLECNCANPDANSPHNIRVDFATGKVEAK